MKANTKRRRSQISISARHRVAPAVPATAQPTSASSHRSSSSHQEVSKDAAGKETTSKEEEEQAAQVLQAVNQAPISRSVARSYFVPWGDALPELVDYYLHNPFDFTGVNLYATPSRYQPSWAQTAMRSAPNFTVQVCLAENARERPLIRERDQLWLKGRALRMTNQSLRTNAEGLSNDTMMAVVTLAFQDLIFEDGRAARFHLIGLSQMVRLKGGFETLSVPLRKLIVEADSLHAYLKHQTKLFPIQSLPPGWAFDPNHPFRLVAFDSGWCHEVSNPLRLAFQPRSSNLSPPRMRNHLVCSLLGTAQSLVLVLNAVQHVAKAALSTPYPLPPSAARSYVSEIEMYILTNLSPLKPYLRLEPAIFSDEDRKYHDLLANCARLCALILLARTIELLERTTLAAAKVDHNAMALGMVDVQPVLDRDPKVGCWVLIIGTAFISPGLQRDRALNNLADTCETLLVTSWEELRNLLRSIFYCCILQEEPCYELWLDIEKQMRQRQEKPVESETS